MVNAKLKKALATVEKVLGTLVGTQKLVLMTPEAFLRHANVEIAKAATEPTAKSQARLSLLYKSVLYSSAVIEDETADNLKVPVFVADQTALATQENDLYTPDAAAKLNPSGGSVFEDGFVAKMLARTATLSKEIDAILKAEDPPADDDETEKAKKKPPMPPAPPGDAPADDDATKAAPPPADDDEDTEKAKGKQPPPFPPPKKDDAEKAKGGDDGDASAPPADDDEKEKAKAAKGDHVWPDDMNDASFVTKGVPSESEWGKD